MKKSIFTLFSIVLFISQSFAQKNPTGDIWLHMLTTGQPAATRYLGDQLNASSTYYIQFEVGQTAWYQSDAGIGLSNTDPSGWTWRTAFWFADGSGSNKQVRSNFADFRFSQTGTWYFNSRAKGDAGDAFHYANTDSWTNTGTFSPLSYFTVNPLNNPSSQAAIANSTTPSSSIDLSWSKDAQSHNVMIIRKKSTQSWTEPTQGTAYIAGNTIGSGVVVYNSSGTSFTNTGLASSTTYDYKFYSENFNYYSAGVVASASTQTAASDYFRSNAALGNWNDVSSWQSSFDNTTWVTSTLAPNSSANTTTVLNSHAISVNGAETVNVLTINNGGILNINASQSLTITGTLTNNAAEGIILQSPLNSGAPGSLITNGSLAGSGTLKAERYIPAYSTAADGWHLISSPVNTPNISSGTNLAPGTNDDFYAWDEVAYVWTNYKPGNVFTTMTNGIGYLVSYQTAATKFMTGNPNNSAITFTNLSRTVGKGDGWHLVGNPFTSALVWNMTGNGSYVLNNIAGIAKMMNNTGSYTDIQADGIIPAMQGFFVQAVNTTNTLTIPTNARTHNPANWNKSGENNSILLAAKDLGSQMVQESRVMINNQATEGYDYQYDSHFLAYLAPQFYSLSGSEMLSTNCLPSIPAESVIPFGFIKNGASNFSIELKESIAGQVVILQDLKTNQVQNLSINPVYTFTSEAGDDPNRFLLKSSTTGWYEDYVKINPNNSGSVHYWIGSNPYFGTQLAGNNFGNVSSLVMTDCDMKYWSSYQDRTGGSFFYKIMSADGNTQIVAPVETIWTQSYLGGNNYQGQKSFAINLLNGLSPDTQYQLHIWAKSWGTSQGDSYLSNDGSNYIATFTYSPSTTFTGTGNWTSAGNWSSGIPSNTSDALIAGNAIISTAVTVNDLTISAGNSLTISPAGSLTVNGSLANDAGAGNLLVKSDATGTGSLIESNSGVNARVERYMTTDTYHSFSPSVSSATADIFHLPGSTGLDVYLYSHNELNNTDPYAGYFEIADVNTPLLPFSGYSVYADGVHATPPVPAWTFVENGSLNTGAFGSAGNMTRTGTGDFAGFNYVGNPYPSFINWDAAGWTKTNINTAIYLENSGNWAIYLNPGPPVNSGSNIIAPGQGFFVHVTDGNTNGTLIMDNAVRTHTSAPFLKSSTTEYVKLIVTGNDRSDETVIRFDDSATPLFDGQFDAAKLGASDINFPQIYSICDRNLAYNAAPKANLVHLGFNAGVSGNYTLSINDIDGISYVSLEDTQTGIFTNLLNNSYSFSYSPGDNEQRFVLHFNPNVSVDESGNSPAIIYSGHGSVNVDLKNNVNGDINIYTISGQHIASVPAAKGSNKISLANPGNYIVKVISSQSTMVKKIYVH